MEILNIKDIKEISIGQVENTEAGTGVTVITSKNGMRAGLDVRGSGPASKESELLKEQATADKINAVVLSGGSAFGLDASGGVMKYLEENGIGYDVGVTKVPLVCQSSLFDLMIGSSSIRPDAKMGYEAAKIALTNPNYKDGNYGAGCGATIGKMLGKDYAMKSGIGSYCIKIGDLIVGALVIVNAYGDVYNYKTGLKYAGMVDYKTSKFLDTNEVIYSLLNPNENKFVSNTTLGVVFTNAYFDKHQLNKMASVTHNGYARCIKPVHTSCDGDSIYALSIGDLKYDLDMVSTIAQDVMSEAILKAIDSANKLHGYKAKKDL